MTFYNLKPGLKYDFQIKTQLKSGGLSQPALASAHTEAIPPGNVQVSDVSISTVSLTWETPAGEVGGFVVTCFCDSETHGEQTTDSESVTFYDLKPGLKYDFQIKTQLISGGLSQPAMASANTEAIPPGNVQVSDVSISTVSLTWEAAAGEVGGYVVTCFCDSETHGEQATDSESVTFYDLKPGLKYDFQIKTQLKSRGLSQPALISAHTEAIPPGNVQVSDVSISTVSLTWETPAGEVGGYVVTCFSDSETRGERTTDSESVTFYDLKPGLKYDFQIKTQLKSGGLSQPALASAHTEPIPPGNFQVSDVSISTVSLTWETPSGEVGGYVVTCFCDSETHGEQTTDSESVTFYDLKPGLKYDFQIKTQLKSGGLSQLALASAHTETKQESLREDLNERLPSVVTPPDHCNYQLIEVPSFGSIEVHRAGTNIIALGWAPTEQQVESHYQLLYSCKIKSQAILITDSRKVNIGDLLPGTEYTFSIIRITDGKHSKSASLSVFTGKHAS
ncbi:fibronectin-like [Gadus morhua]|uniref:fibronectin-like n=1 Tax=Gadus morhua TaxID=8049 RepID=UPI0011B81CBB|nr:fibronectin-like [Gadus morhua]